MQSESQTLNNQEIKQISKGSYAQVVDSLIYVMTSMRPDICCAVGFVSRCQNKSLKRALKASERISRILIWNKTHEIMFRI